MGLRQLERRHAELALEHAAEMAVAHAQLAGELAHAATVERAGADPVRRHPREPRHRIDDRPPGGQLRPAAEARPEAGPLGGGGGIEEPAAVVVRYPGRTDGAAVDPGRGDADEEEPIEPGVPGVERALAGRGAEEGRGDDDAGHGFQFTRAKGWGLAGYGPGKAEGGDGGTGETGRRARGREGTGTASPPVLHLSSLLRPLRPLRPLRLSIVERSDKILSFPP